MPKKILSPVSRIEGHLSVEVKVKEGQVTEVRIRGEMYRGIENIVLGRRPLDAIRIVQRICGVCHEVHGIAAARAVAQIYGVHPPPNGILLMDIILALHLTCDHILHFYQLALPDYVDFSVLTSYRGSDLLFRQLRDWLAVKRPFLLLKKALGDYIKDPKIVSSFFAHYIEALEMVAKGGQGLAVLGSKAPFSHAVFPGGISSDLSADRIAKVESITQELYRFVKTAYLPDVKRLARLYPAYFRLGVGWKNFLAYGGFASLGEPLFEAGVLISGHRQPLSAEKIVEHVAYSYYEGEAKPFFEEDTRPRPKKPRAYSWIKAPRYDGHPVETGPLARIWFSKEGKSRFLACLKELGYSEKEAFSVMGRHLARALETELLLEFVLKALDKLDPAGPTITNVNPEEPVSGQAYALSNAARGDLLHYLEVDRGRIRRYQAVVPTTWNFSPRDENGLMGPAEKAIVGTPVAYKEGLIEVGRVVRSFDPCMACSVH